MCLWVKGCGWSPNRIDGLVWVLTELMIKPEVRSWRPLNDELREEQPVPEDNFIPMQSWRPF